MATTPYRTEETAALQMSLEQIIAAARMLPAEARRQLCEALQAGDRHPGDELDAVLTQAGNPVLAALWDNESDAVYDTL